MQVDRIKPKLKPLGTERLKLKYDEPPSNFAFEFNLRHNNEAAAADADREMDEEMGADAAGVMDHVRGGRGAQPMAAKHMELAGGANPMPSGDVASMTPPQVEGATPSTPPQWERQVNSTDEGWSDGHARGQGQRQGQGAGETGKSQQQALPGAGMFMGGDQSVRLCRLTLSNPC